MISNRPYLLRAFYQWIVDSCCTPILVMDASYPRCKIPQGYAEGGEIVFNISSTAIRDLKISNDSIEFKASFSSVIHLIFVPIKAVLAIYAEENGEGIFFDPEQEDSSEKTNQFESIDNSVEKPQEHSSEYQKSIDSNKVIKKKPILTLIE